MLLRMMLSTSLVIGVALSATPLRAQAPARPTGAASGFALARIAPDDSLAVVVSNGWKKASPTTQNKAERLWAEQSVQDFLQQLGDEIQKAVKSKAQESKEADLAGMAVPVFLQAAIKHPMIVTLNSFNVESPPDIKLALVLDTEQDQAAVKDVLDKLIASAPKTGPSALIERTVEGAKFYRPNPPPVSTEPPPPEIGMYKSYVIVAMGQSTVEDTIKRINAPAKNPSWADSLAKDMPVDRPTFGIHVNMQGILKIVDSKIEEPDLRKGLEASGLLSIKRLGSVTGLDAVGLVDKMLLETTGAPKGLLALLPKKPLTADDLKYIPANPANANVVRFDLAYAAEQILRIADQVNPQAREQFEAISNQGEQVAGFSIVNDLIPSFGDTWSMYVSNSEPGGMVPGFVVAATVRDSAKLTKVIDAAVAQANLALQQQGGQAQFSIVEFTARGNKGYRVLFNGLPVPVSPSFLVTKDQFVLGLTPQLVTAHLGNGPGKPTLADNPFVKAGMARDKNAVVVSFRDPKPEVQGIYTLVNTVGPVMLAQLQSQGIEFTMPPLPPYGDLEQHLEPSVSTYSYTPNGWKSEGHGVVPSISASSPAVAGVMVALLLPAVQQAREAARRAQTKNNLKQIALAMHNYHDAFNTFPARSIQDKNGKPLLSWRVKMLPYLDEHALYQEFKLDEPWDSPHNKALISKMPRVYENPNDPNTGKTRYVVPTGKGTLFEGADGPQIRSITDGTSNTIMTLETHVDKAVIWTKPDDLEIDFKDPLAGLKGARVGGFHAGLADGSVRFISEFIDVEILKALFTKAGGENIGNF